MGDLGAGVVVLDADFGNISAVVGAVKTLGIPSTVSRNPSALVGASALIIPGVGHFASGMRNLRELKWVDPIRDFAAAGGRIVGICLGMHLLGDHGVEGGHHEGIGLIPGSVNLLQTAGKRLPHIGWSQVSFKEGYEEWNGRDLSGDYYFVHSYAFVPRPTTTVVAESVYGAKFPSVVRNGNVIGIQFHPEKSQRKGLWLLQSALTGET